VFRMSVIRKASLDVHATAKDVEEDAKYAAHAAGQAVATAHVATHALGCSVYAIRAVAAYTDNVNDGLIKERSWQLQRLREITTQSKTEQYLKVTHLLFYVFSFVNVVFWVRLFDGWFVRCFSGKN
jgi:hypothetical protein